MTGESSKAKDVALLIVGFYLDQAILILQPLN